jgi:carboxyl-terminal processing protease
MRKSGFQLLGLIFFLFIFMPSYAQIFNEHGLKFLKLFSLIEDQYVDTVNLDKLSDEAIRDILHKLDPHSIYMTKDEVAEMNEPLIGNFDGVGISFSIFRDSVLVITCVPDGPSEKAGLKAGDRIVYADNDLLTGSEISSKDVINHLKGPKGSYVKVKVKRYGVNKLLEFKIERNKIPIESVDAFYHVNDSTGYIRLSKFSATTGSEIGKILKQFKSEKIKNIIIDLSDNTGGYLDMAVNLADQFLSNGEKIVYTQGVHSEKIEYSATSIGLYETGKLVVIINENSASASEIFAGAVQDWDRAIIVGRRSFGKGLVQRAFSFPDGSAIRLTIARYYTPSGRLIQKSYANGYSAYNNELYSRLKDGELYGKNTKISQDSTQFFTLTKNRIVYGGGGISPDIYVPLDSNSISPFIRKIYAKNCIREFTFNYLDGHRKFLKTKYPEFIIFKKDFELNSEDLTEFIRQVKEKKITFTEEEFNDSQTKIKTLIKAEIAKDYWNYSCFYEIYNSIVPEFQKAVDALNNWDTYLK